MKVVRIVRCKMLHRTKIVVVKLLKMAEVTPTMKNQAACIWEVTNRLLAKG
jgi:hypothetical protein